MPWGDSKPFAATLLLAVGLAAAVGPATSAAAAPPPAGGAAAAPLNSGDDIDRYRPAVARLIGEALLSTGAAQKLERLCDDIGHRLSGSEALDRAIAWAQAAMTADGLQNVHAEPVMVPHWVRGRERASIETPIHHELHILGLGGSVGTPAGGLTAEAVVVSTMAGLDSLGAGRIKDRIVVFDAPFESYGQTVLFRVSGASRAARLGAAAVLIRSVTPRSLDTPHTGSLRYTEDSPQIPAAAITIEDAALLHRLADRGTPIRIHLEMEARTLEDVPSANVIGEVPGTDPNAEIVVLGGHLDSWDVGQGAQDDGTGVVVCMEAAHLIRRLGLAPRRTVRVVLWTNEENGLRGGRGYRDAHRAEWPRHVAAIESDIGNGAATGFDIDLRPRMGLPADSLRQAWVDSVEAAARASGLDLVRKLSPLLAPLNATEMNPGHGGADVGPLAEEGIAALGLRNDTSQYFDIHHTWADTFDKVDLQRLSVNVATMAVMTYLLAEIPERLLPPPVTSAMPAGTH